MLRPMADDRVPKVEHPTDELLTPYIRVKEGHPRFNLVVLLLLVAALIVFALVQAQRLQF